MGLFCGSYSLVVLNTRIFCTKLRSHLPVSVPLVVTLALKNVQNSSLGSVANIHLGENFSRSLRSVF